MQTMNNQNSPSENIAQAAGQAAGAEAGRQAAAAMPTLEELQMLMSKTIHQTVEQAVVSNLQAKARNADIMQRVTLGLSVLSALGTSVMGYRQWRSTRNNNGNQA